MHYLILLFNLALTAVIEGALILLICRRSRYVYYSLLCNLLTNPALNFLLMLYGSLVGERGYMLVMLCLEVAAVLVEAAVYRTLCELTFWRALGMSALLNAASFLLGAVIYSFARI